MNGSDKARAVDEDHDVEDLNSAIAVYNAADLPLRRRQRCCVRPGRYGMR